MTALPLADWRCPNGHDNPWRCSRCWACDGDIEDEGVTLIDAEDAA